MSQPPIDTREAIARLEFGMVGVVEARMMLSTLHNIVFTTRKEAGEEVQICRHCHGRRDIGHSDNCIAEEVE